MSAEIYGSVNGVTRKAKKLYANVNGVTREIKELWANVNGVTRKIYSSGAHLAAQPYLESYAPSWDTSLSENEAKVTSNSELYAFAVIIQSSGGRASDDEIDFGVTIPIDLGDTKSFSKGTAALKINKGFQVYSPNIPRFHNNYDYRSGIKAALRLDFSSKMMWDWTNSSAIYVYSSGTNSFESYAFTERQGGTVQQDFQTRYVYLHIIKILRGGYRREYESYTTLEVTIPSGAISILSNGEELPVNF